MTLAIFLQVLALVLLLLAAVNVTYPRVNFGWLGLFLWLLSLMVKI